MEVTLQLKRWNVAVCEKTNKPKIVGTYAVVCAGKEIAKQDFNAGGYSVEKEITFSPALTESVIKLENDIKAELELLLK
jgi:hypothetical protein